MKIYTKTGDKGETGLIGGRRVSKASLRIESYGTVDELNAMLGLVQNKLVTDILKKSIKAIQNELHIICADLANTSTDDDQPHIEEQHTKVLEELCDQLDEKLPELKNFILPGGSEAGAMLHLARTIARRAERRVIELAAIEKINDEVIRYLNRLSDCLFLMARMENSERGEIETSPDY
jgi:cob(I)alamin adenosyltransferase